MATTNKRFVAKNGLDNNGQTITNVGAVGTSLAMSGTGDVTIVVSGTATLTVPAGSDTLVTLTGSQTLTNKTISGSNNTLSNIGNGSLTNSSVSYNGVSVALGASGTLYTDDISEDASPTNKYFTDARARGAISVTDSGGDGSLSYDSGTGVITYTGPSASEVRAHFSAGTGVTISSGQVSIGQAVATTDNVTFAGVTADVVRLGVTAAGEIDTSSGNLTIDSTGGTTVMDDDVNVTGNLQIDGNLTVSGTTVTINATNLAIEDNMIYLNNGSTVTHPDLGFAGNYNDGTYRHAGLFRDESDGVWKLFHQYTPEPDASAYIDITHPSFALAPLQVSTITGTLVGAAPAGSLSGSTLASGVTASSLTSVGTLTSLTVSGASTLQGYAWMKDATEFGNRASVSSVSLYQTCNWATTSYIASRIKFDDSGYLRIGNSIGIPIANAPSTATYTDLVTIDSTGKVGIGTTTPIDNLDVFETGGSTNWRGRIISRNDTGNRAAFLGVYNGVAGVFAHDNALANWATLYVNAVDVISGTYGNVVIGGNVGIGTTNPSFLLDVQQSNAGGVVDFRIANTNNANAASGTRNITSVAGSSAGDPLLLLNILAVQDWHIGVDNSDSDKFMIGTGGTVGSENVLTATVGGNVGIGTSSPEARLDIIGATQGTITTLGSEVPGLIVQQRLTSDSNGNAGPMIDFRTSNGADVWTQGAIATIAAGTYAGQMAFYTQPGGTTDTTGRRTKGASLVERLRIKENGYVGIGTTDPQYPLEVKLSSEIQLRVVGSSTGYTQGAIVINGGTDSTPDNRGQGIFLFNEGQDVTWYMGTNYNAGSTFSINRQASTTSVAPSTAQLTYAYLTIDNAGNVGIGTTIPGEKLQVTGNIRLTSAGNKILYDGSSGGTTRLNQIEMYSAADGGMNFSVTHSSTGGIKFNTAGDTKLTVAYGGNVGIGTTNPDTKLHVSSTGDIKYIQINTTATANKRTRIQFTQNNSAGLEIGTDYNLNNTSDFYLYNRDTGGTIAYMSQGTTWFNGNVGIGITDPAGYKLYVNGNVLINGTQGFNATDETATLYIGDSASAIQAVYDRGMLFYQNGTERMRIQGVTGHIVPGANGTQNLGSDSLRWATVFTSDLSLSNGIGDWTIVEGEDDLFIYNNKNNKVYKFTLQEVDPSTATPKKS